MKKILLTSILIFIVIILYVFCSLGMGVLGVPSIAIINDNSKNLNLEIEEVKSILTEDYDNAMIKLNSSVQSYINAKQTYDDALSLYSGKDVQSISPNTQYTLEFLLIKLGKYAKANNLKRKFEITPFENTKNNIKFTLIGDYIGIKNFISSIGNDKDLRLIVEDLNMIATENGVQATFTCKGLTVLK